MKVICEFDVKFESYGKKSLDKKAESGIIKWIKETLENECSYIPMYVEKDENGSLIEDCTKRTKIKVKKN